jgi:hypothetical protein
MWYLIAADDKKSNLRKAKFSKEGLALNYLAQARSREFGKIFKDSSVLCGCVWAKVVFEEEIPLDPIL